MDNLLLLIAAAASVIIVVAGIYAMRRNKARDERPEDLYPLF